MTDEHLDDYLEFVKARIRATEQQVERSMTCVECRQQLTGEYHSVHRVPFCDRWYAELWGC